MSFFKFVQDEALSIRVSGMPIHRFFNPEEFLKYGLEPIVGNTDCYTQIIDMPIDKFLGLAEPIPDDDEKRHAPQEQFRQDILNGKSTNWEIPYLKIRENEDGIWKVTGHDGRHRGMLLKSLGYDTMPVRLDIYACLNEELLPEILWVQNDKAVEREKDYYEFPINEDNFGQPYVSLEGNFVSVQGDNGQSIALAEIPKANVPHGTKASLLKFLAGESAAMDSQVPNPCAVAKRNFKKNFVENVAYRIDNTMPAKNLKEYLAKGGDNPKGTRI